MPFLKSIKTEYGVDASYWKITVMDTTKSLKRSAHVVLSGWVDRDSFVAKDREIATRTYDWGNGEFPFTQEEPQNEYQISYNKIKSTDEFLGAIDIDL